MRIPARILEVHEGWRQKVGTQELNACIRRAIDHNPPQSVGGEKPLRIYYATQVRTAPPTIRLFVSQPRRLAKTYERYLTRELRRAFGFCGSPIRIRVQKSK